MRRALRALTLLAGLTWGGMVGWAVNVPETKGRGEIRTAAFVVMFGAGLLLPVRRGKREDPHEETL